VEGKREKRRKEEIKFVSGRAKHSKRRGESHKERSPRGTEGIEARTNRPTINEERKEEREGEGRRAKKRLRGSAAEAGGRVAQLPLPRGRRRKEGGLRQFAVSAEHLIKNKEPNRGEKSCQD